MNFDSLNKVACIPGTGGNGANGSGGGGTGGGSDQRCSDSAFASANPDICGDSPYLIIKPSSSLIIALDSVQFNVFIYKNGSENQLTSGVLFGSSDPTIFIVGASSGNGTGISKGNVVVTATYQGLSATAQVTVLDPTIGCSQTKVATAILVDDSISMNLAFGGAYSTRFKAAKAVASSYAGVISTVGGLPKDFVTIYSFDDAPNQVSTDYIQDTNQLLDDINSITQSQGDTDLKSVLSDAITSLNDLTVDMRVILLISDGEQTDSPTEQDVLNAAATFKQSGGVVICFGLRASGTGFDLLDRLATGGFFLNAVSSNIQDMLSGLSFLKSAVCAGACVPNGDFYKATAELDYSSFKNWSVIKGQVNLFGNGFMDLLPGNGLYVALAADNNPATIETIDSFQMNAGDAYSISFSLAGNNQLFTPAANASVTVYIKDEASGEIIYTQTVSVDYAAGFNKFSFSFSAPYSSKVVIGFTQTVAQGYTGPLAGNLLDKIVFEDATAAAILFEDDFDEENIQYTPPACGLSAARSALADPSKPLISYLNYAGGSQVNSEIYKYAVSYKTQQGETAASPVSSTADLMPVTLTNQSVLVGNIFPSPATYPPNRILSIRIWRNDDSASDSLYLLAEISPEAINYVDLESHAQFSARADTGKTAPNANTTAVSQGALGSGSVGCYEPVCEPEIAVGAQLPDPNPLGNIESTGGPSGTVFKSSQQVCKSCQDGATLYNLISSLKEGDLIPVSGGMMWDFLTSSITDKVCFTFNPIGDATQASLSIFGSDDAITWTPINLSQTWYNGTTIVQASGIISGNTITLQVLASCIGYAISTFRYIKLGFDTANWKLVLASVEQLVVNTSGQICKSASASSTVSQSDADSKATAAATQLVQQALNGQCFSSYVSTKNYTATCACGQYGNPVTVTETFTSLVSQADADGHALSAAQAAATSQLECNLSNNTQNLFLPNTTTGQTTSSISTIGQANPYPLVKYLTQVGTVNKVVAKINGLETFDGNGIVAILVSPSGRTCVLMSNCWAVGLHIGEFNFTGQAVSGVQGLYLVFDDSSGDSLQSSSNTTHNGVACEGGIGTLGPSHPVTVKPTVAGTNWTQLQAINGCIKDLLANSQAHGTTLAVFNGDTIAGSWSLWIYQTNNQGSGFIYNGFDLVIT